MSLYRTIYKMRLVAAILVLILGGQACEESEVQKSAGVSLIAPGNMGSFVPASIEFTLVDEARDSRPLPSIVWYPTTLDPAKNPVPVSSPVFVYSHGSGADIDFHDFTVEHLVSRGYVVALVAHTGNIGINEFSPSITAIAVHRPLDVLFLMDHLEKINANDSVVAGRLNLSLLALGGHSFGGYTTQVLCGAEFDGDQLNSLCHVDEPDLVRCAVARRITEVTGLVDDRIDACLIYAPSVNGWFGEDKQGLAAIDKPLLLVSGDEDTLTTNEGHIEAFSQYTKDVQFLTLTGGGHLGFTDIANDGSMTHDRMKNLLNLVTDAYLDWKLLGSTMGAEVFDSVSASYVGLQDDVLIESK